MDGSTFSDITTESSEISGTAEPRSLFGNFDDHNMYKTRRCEKYSQLSMNFKPLDLVLFRGTDLVSETITILSKLTTGDGEFAHVGTIVNSELLPHVKELESGKWYVLESTMSASRGLMANYTDGIAPINSTGKFGVQIRDLEKVVSKYTITGKVAWASLIGNPWDTNRENTIRVVSNAHDLLGTMTYDANFLSLVAAVCPCLRKTRDRFNKILAAGDEMLVSMDLAKPGDSPDQWLFCSELVATIYKDLGIISANQNASNAIPVDFLGVDADGIPNLVMDPIYIIP